MKTYFGNYLGLVVNDKDPQQRGRVQVFIPHIMPALYDEWNKEGKDISFNITDDNIITGLSKSLVERLQKMLPWAECAAPIIGSGPAGIYDYETGQLNQVAGNLGSQNFGQDDLLEDPLAETASLTSTDDQIRAAAAVENGLLGECSQSLCARGANNILSFYTRGYGEATSGADAAQMGPILQSEYNMSVIADNGTYRNGDTRILTGPGTQHMETYMNGRWYSDFPQNNSSVSNPRYNSATLYRLPTTDTNSTTSNETIENGEYNPSAEDFGMADADSKSRISEETDAIEDSSTGTDTVSLSGEEAYEDPMLISDEELMSTAEQVLDTDISLTGESLNTTETSTEATTEQVDIPDPSPYGTVGGHNTNFMPTGVFSHARTGQMVWVFFREGDPLYPVYFAASYGQAEWYNINSTSSPNKVKFVKTEDNTEEDPLQGAISTLNLNSGGFRDTQIISGQPSGFEKDEFAFEVFGKNGSCLTFTFHATLLNSKYDFRQHTQADAHYITGGNRTDRTVGDFNTVCEQDVIVTIGNWSQEALNAADNIQGVIDDAMKAAKDTYEA